MPFARKSRIFGLHSIPANTTPVSLKNRLLSGFSLTRCFSAALVSGKTENAALPPQIQILGFIDRLKHLQRIISADVYFNSKIQVKSYFACRLVFFGKDSRLQNNSQDCFVNASSSSAAVEVLFKCFSSHLFSADMCGENAAK